MPGMVKTTHGCYIARTQRLTWKIAIIFLNHAMKILHVQVTSSKRMDLQVKSH